jgi:hypothetical protein
VSSIRYPFFLLSPGIVLHSQSLLKVNVPTICNGQAKKT